MCFDIKTNLETQLKRAIPKYSDQTIDLFDKFKNQIPKNYHHVSGFSHPKMIIYTNKNPYSPTLSNWGLIPFWTRDQKQANSIRTNTLNARGETIFEKPSFRKAANSNKCIIHIDGYYEHHHYKGKTYPFFIFRKDQKPLSIAGLWDEWININTGEVLNSFSIITTKANQLMQKIHNNPKLTEGRMPVVINNEEEDQWLTAENKNDCLKYIIPFEDHLIEAYNVGKIRGKHATGNTPEAHQKITYKELSNF